MHDVTHYGWLTKLAKPDATTVASLRGHDGQLAVWRATRLNKLGIVEPVPHEEAMAAKVGDDSTAIHVYANHGRWIVECPDCHDAQLAVRDDHRFMCVGCANESVDGLWRPVIWPKEHATIETLLDARTDQHARNWHPREKVSALKAENKERGVA